MNARSCLVSSVRLFVFALVACGPGFRINDYPTPVSLYNAGVAEYTKGNWDHAVTALDRVTNLLGPRDTLLPRAELLLGRAYEKKKSFLLAAATYKRLFDDFPEDSLADDALLGVADANAQSWRGPEYSAEHGITSLESYSLLQRLFPNSPLVKRAQEGERRVQEALAQKDLRNGVFYMKRGAYESALIPLKDAVDNFPSTAAAREAMIKMVEVYRNPKVKYADDARDMCKRLRGTYAGDPGVVKACAGIPVDTTK
ncbi:MAG TPA: outer membrane protein assembly factor BamD [Gemmatimonadaceae bacterium]|nr:outer membrane protein assembly factor BamD [Gemmatimonadaceae bacterium]